MVDVERQFVCKVIQDGDLVTALDRQIGVGHLADGEHRVVYDLLLEHWRNYGKVPAKSIVVKNYPNYGFVQAPEPMEYYIAEVARAYRHRVLVQGVNEIAALLEEGPVSVDAAEAALRRLVAELDVLRTSVLSDEEIISTATARLAEYEKRRDNIGGLLGIPTGFATIDKATLGLQPEQFVLVIGPPAAGKSTLLLRLAVNVVERPAAKALFVGFEMSNAEQTARAHAMFAQVSHRRLVTGQLLESESRRWAQRFAFLDAQDSRLVVIGDRAGAMTVSALGAKIEEHKPDLVVVDGLYLMTDEHGEHPGSPQALTNITRAIKQLAQRFSLPILASTQALTSKMSRGAVSLDSIGYSSSFAQDADVIIGVQPGGDESGLMETRLIKVRSGPRGVLQIDADWETGTFRELAGAIEGE